MKYVRKISSIISTLLLILLLICVGALAVPKVMGVEIRAIISGSMTPNYNIGDMVYAFPAEFRSIREGDVISYVLNEDLTVVTHRVVEVDVENQQFYTQGDANSTRDGSAVKYENVLGVVKFAVPYAGRIVMLMEDPMYKILAMTAVAVLAILSIIIMINSKGDPEEEEPPEEIAHEVHKETAAAAMEEKLPMGAPSEKAAEVMVKLKAWESQLSDRQKELDEKEKKLERHYRIYQVEEELSAGGRIKALFRNDETLFARIAVLIVLLLAIVNVTFALLSQRTDDITNNFSIGKVPVEIDEGDIDPDEVDWGNDNKPVSIINRGTVDAVVRVMIVPEFIDKADGEKHLGGNLDIFQAPDEEKLKLGDIVLHFAEPFIGGASNNWLFNPADGYFYYKKVLGPEETTEQLLAGVTLHEDADMEAYEGIQVQIQVYADSLQAYGGAAEEWNLAVNEETGSVSLKP